MVKTHHAQPEAGSPASIGAGPGGSARSTILRAGAAAIVLVLFIAAAVSYLLIDQKRQEFLSAFEGRLFILAEGRADVVATWLEESAERTARIVDSDLFRLFATEVDLALGDISDQGGTGPDLALSDALLEQVPFMERVLSDFVSGEEFSAGYLVARDLGVKVSNTAAQPLSDRQRDLVSKTLDREEPGFSSLYETQAGLHLDMALPVAPAQASAERSVGVMVFSMPVAGRLAELLGPRPGTQPGDTVRLLQQHDGDLEALFPGQADAVRVLDRRDLFAETESIGFANRPEVGGGRAVYSIGAPVAGSSWWILQEHSAATAERELDTYEVAVLSVAGLSVVAILLAFGAVWWRLASQHHKTLAAHFQSSAATISRQKRLLDSINGAISEHIGLKDEDGIYRYVNPAFAAAMGRPIGQMIGLDDEALFGHGTAQRLEIADRRARETGLPVTLEERLYISGKQRVLQFCKAPYHDDSDNVTGLVSVSRDVTELVDQREKREKAVKQTIAALVLAIEARDPYLTGHSRRVADLAAEIAKQVGASAEEISTVAIAADLCQVGKLGVPRSVLTKPARLDEPELALVRGHVAHAANLLREIDFGLPVLDTITQMHERIDGKGYPHGLLGHEISQAAQILGLCDVFCARVEPRAHRQGIGAGEALAILEGNPERYSPVLVAALRSIVESVQGEKLVAGIARKQLAR